METTTLKTCSKAAGLLGPSFRTNATKLPVQVRGVRLREGVSSAWPSCPLAHTCTCQAQRRTEQGCGHPTGSWGRGCSQDWHRPGPPPPPTPGSPRPALGHPRGEARRGGPADGSPAPGKRTSRAEPHAQRRPSGHGRLISMRRARCAPGNARLNGRSAGSAVGRRRRPLPAPNLPISIRRKPPFASRQWPCPQAQPWGTGHLWAQLSFVPTPAAAGARPGLTGDTAGPEPRPDGT